MANVLGGGDAQRVEVAIADQEARLGELQRRRSQLESEIRDQVLALVLEIERQDRVLAGLRLAQAANAQRLAVLEVGYRFGQGSTGEMMRLWQPGGDGEGEAAGG